MQQLVPHALTSDRKDDVRRQAISLFICVIAATVRITNTILQCTLSDWCDGSRIHNNGLEPNGEHGNEVII